jgi:cell division protein FtsQ
LRKVEPGKAGGKRVKEMARILKLFHREKGRPSKGEERLQALLKRSMAVAFQLLLLSFFLFTGHWVYVHLLEDSYFRVREVEIEGCSKIRPEAIRSLILIEGMPNLFAVKLEEVAAPVEAHPWVDQVVVRKIFPNKIRVQIEERKPVAILQLEKLYYIDAKGVIFSPVGEGDGYNFPFVTGLTRQALEKDSESSRELLVGALELVRMTEAEKRPPLGEISEIHLSSIFGVQCYAKADGLEVRMGKDSFAEKVRRLSIVWSDIRKKGLSVTCIDCSDADRIVVTRTRTG